MDRPGAWIPGRLGERVITAREHALYTNVWGGIPNYRDVSPGVLALNPFLEMSNAVTGTVFDAGCGSGAASLALAERGFSVLAGDITSAGIDFAAFAAADIQFTELCLWEPFEIPRVNYVYCCDVMEHVPPEYSMLVVDRLLDTATTGAFFSISLVPDRFGVFVGKALHQHVQSFEWWRDHLNEMGHVIEARDLLATGLYWVKP
jgi:SAM-dependent methyltransferase